MANSKLLLPKKIAGQPEIRIMTSLATSTPVSFSVYLLHSARNLSMLKLVLRTVNGNYINATYSGSNRDFKLCVDEVIDH